MQSVWQFMRSRFGAIFIVTLILISGILWWQYIRAAPVRRHIEAGTRFLQEGQRAQAELEWRKAVQLAPDNANVWDLLADYYMSAGNWPEAQNALQRVAELRPNIPLLHTRMAICALKLGDEAKARTYAQAALKRNPNDVEALRLSADMARRAGAHDEQLKYLRHLAELKPRDVNALNALADELARRAEYAQSRVFIERVLKEDPDFVPAYFLRGLTIFSDNPTSQQLHEAKGDFQKVLQLQPGHIEAHRYLGRIYLRLNQPAQAISHFEAVGQGRPYASAHLLELANAYRKVGQIEKSTELRELFSILKQKNRQIMDVKNRLSQSPNSVGDLLQMARLLLDSVNSSAASYYLYAYRYNEKELAGVDFYVREVLKIQPDNAQAKTLLQKVEQSYLAHLQTGQKALARKDFKKADWEFNHAVLLRPDDERTQKALRQLAAEAPSMMNPYQNP